jgi:type I restriction enzyme M protein
MLDLQRQDAINAAVWRACDVFRGVSDPGDSKDFALAMLVLKYISDVGQDHLGPTDEHSDGTRFVVPEGSSFYALLAASLKAGNGERIDKALRAIEEANIGLQGTFQGISFNATALGSVEQKDRVLCQLLEAFQTDALDFRADQERAAEAVACACDSLIKCVAEISGKRRGEFFTPPEVSQLIARLMQPGEGDTISDPCCGSGSLLITCSQLARQSSRHKGCVLYGQEKNGSTWALAKMNMILHGESRNQLEWGDTLRDPKLLADDGSLRKFEIVVSSPPFSLRDWGHEGAERDLHQRYRRGVPPRTAGDYAFIGHMVETLMPKTGRMAAVVPHGVLFRGAVERQIRERLIQENLIDAVIALPAKMFFHTGIPVALLVVRKNKTDDRVLFIDASRSYQHGKTRNILRQIDLDMIEGTYSARHDVNQFARLVSQTEIVANDCNLSIARYIDAMENEAEIDLMAIRAERAQLKAELARLEVRLAALLKETGHAYT